MKEDIQPINLSEWSFITCVVCGTDFLVRKTFNDAVIDKGICCPLGHKLIRISYN